MGTTGDGNGEGLVRDVGRRIAEVRAAKGLTQERFAEAMGIELRNVQRLEGGRANITLSTLARVARALGVLPTALLETPASRVTVRGRPRRPADRQRVSDPINGLEPTPPQGVPPAADAQQAAVANPGGGTEGTREEPT
jgi:transcriptional regulator with XRE-family HTH domain